MILWIKPISSIIISILCLMHPVHVSITSAEYQPQKKEITLSFKVFTNDFRLLFAHLYQIDIDFSKDGNYAKYQEKMDQYFNDHFKLKQDNQDYRLVSGKIKLDQDYILFNYQVNNVVSIDSMKIVNTILMDLYMDQKNLMIFKSGDLEEGYRYDYKTTEHLIEMK